MPRWFVRGTVEQILLYFFVFYELVWDSFLGFATCYSVPFVGFGAIVRVIAMLKRHEGYSVEKENRILHPLTSMHQFSPLPAPCCSFSGKAYLHRLPPEVMRSIPQSATLLARFIADFLQFTHFPLLARLAYQPHAVQPDLIAVAIPTDHVDDEARDVLELDEPEPNVGCAVRVPVAFRQLDGLRWRRVVGFTKVQVMRLVSIQVDLAGPHRRIVIIFGR